jgi:hypothetical protein
VSGEASAATRGRFHELVLGSGVSIGYATLPGQDAGALHAADCAPLAAWIERARPGLDALFAELAADAALPLAPIGDRHQEVAGVVIEDRQPDAGDHFRHHAGEGPYVVRLDVPLRGPDGPLLERARLRLSVTARVHRSALDALGARVAAVLERSRTG